MIDKETVEGAARFVIQRWMNVGMLRFNSYDDGSDDLLLAAEIARESVVRANDPIRNQIPANPLRQRSK